MIRTARHRAVALTGALLLSASVMAGCGGSSPTEEDTTSSAPDADADADTDADAGIAAADTTVCAADAAALEGPYGEAFPTDWAFPPQTTVYDVEDREGAGTIVTAISTAPYDDVLAFLNDDEPAAGYDVTGGETEEDDAEADFTVTGFTGRWSIRASATCPGETVVQVVAFAPGG